MARSGSFGRLPRTAPDLSSTIVAMLREYENMRESNITDAWQNGGEFEGKKVTDDMLLDFYKKKLADVSSDDPLYDHYRNTLAQYTFAIENSKMELKYAQKKVGDGAMVAFYKSWANKLPTDSEAYRQRMKLAAGYADHASASGRASASAAKVKAYTAQRDAIIRHDEAAYDIVTGAIINLAKQGLPYQILDTNTQDLTDLRFDQNDSTHLMQLFDTISKDPRLAQWRTELTAYVRANGDPDFNGDFSYNNVVTVLGNAKLAGARKRENLAKANGYKTDANAARKEGNKTRSTLTSLKSTDERARYETERAEWDRVINDPDATLAEKWDATQHYRGEVTKIRDSAMESGDSVIIGRLNTEVAALAGDTSAKGPTMAEESTGGEKTGGGEKGDAFSTAESVRLLTEKFGLLSQRDADGQPTYVQTLVNEKGEPVPAGTKGAKYDIVPAAAVKGTAAFTIHPGDAATDLKFDGGTAWNASGVVTAIVGEPITLVGRQVDERGQVAATVGDPIPVGMRFVTTNGTPAYSFLDDTGALKYSLANPYAGEITRGSKGLEVTQTFPFGKTPPDKLNYGAAFNQDAALAIANGSMPNTIVDSLPALEMLVNPREAYRASPSAIQATLLAQANGDPVEAARLYAQVDTLRANYVAGGDYAALNRLVAARQRGDLPLTIDYARPAGEHGARPGAPMKGPAEQAAIDKFFAENDTAQEQANAIGSAMLKRFGINIDINSEMAKARALGATVANRNLDDMRMGRGAPVLRLPVLPTSQPQASTVGQPRPGGGWAGSAPTVAIPLTAPTIPIPTPAPPKPAPPPKPAAAPKAPKAPPPPPKPPRLYEDDAGNRPYAPNSPVAL
jgi:hypothetical protein